MDVRADDFCNAPREEVPDDDAAIVAAHGQQGPPAVECAGESHADTVQSAICLLTTQIRQTQSKTAAQPASSLQLSRKSTSM